MGAISRYSTAQRWDSRGCFFVTSPHPKEPTNQRCRASEHLHRRLVVVCKLRLVEAVDILVENRIVISSPQHGVESAPVPIICNPTPEIALPRQVKQSGNGEN